MIAEQKRTKEWVVRILLVLAAALAGVGLGWEAQVVTRAADVVANPTPTQMVSLATTPTEVLVSEPTVLGDEPDETPSPEPAPACTHTVTVNGLRVRLGPGTNSGVVTWLNKGDCVRVYELRTVGSDEWARISAPEEAARWVARKMGTAVYLEPIR